MKLKNLINQYSTIDMEKLSKDYPVVLCGDGLYRYLMVWDCINLKARGYRSRSAAARARNRLDGIPWASRYIING